MLNQRIITPHRETFPSLTEQNESCTITSPTQLQQEIDRVICTSPQAQKGFSSSSELNKLDDATSTINKGDELVNFVYGLTNKDDSGTDDKSSDEDDDDNDLENDPNYIPEPGYSHTSKVMMIF